jgi:NAD(P)-dependent dehydrogenase (short-subunit alcohol dehydrogenase family)
MASASALRRQRSIQEQVARANKARPKQEPFPKQHQSKPGSESSLDPAPLYDAPFYLGSFYLGSRKLDKKVALIMGGDSGIGRAGAILFAREGADIALAYLREHKDARITKEKVEAEGRRCLLIAGDVFSQKFCDKALAQTVREFGLLDVLVNNAAFQIHASQFEDLTARHFDEAMKTTLYGYFYMAQASAKHMKSDSAIVNTGSVTGLPGNENLIDYSMTKGGIHAFTRSLATHLVLRGIRVNAGKFGADTPTKRPAPPEEIAPAYVFLASPQCSSYITVEVLPIIGGYSGG